MAQRSARAAGYSGTPLAKKLGLEPDCTLVLVGAPKNYAELIGPSFTSMTRARRVTRATDVVHIFATSKAKLSSSVRESLTSMRPDATIWVSWPKKAAKVATDITENVIRDVALPLGLVDVKVCAVDETWSGLKLVLRKERRG